MTLSDAWVAATGIAICILVPFLIGRLRTQSADAMSRVVHRAARTAVLAVEQTSSTDSPEIKFQKATHIVDRYLRARRLNFPEEKIDAVIESEVYLLTHPENK